LLQRSVFVNEIGEYAAVSLVEQFTVRVGKVFSRQHANVLRESNWIYLIQFSDLHGLQSFRGLGKAKSEKNTEVVRGYTAIGARYRNRYIIPMGYDKVKGVSPHMGGQWHVLQEIPCVEKVQEAPCGVVTNIINM
jgi:hypothetical protein